MAEETTDTGGFWERPVRPVKSAEAIASEANAAASAFPLLLIYLPGFFSFFLLVKAYCFVIIYIEKNTLIREITPILDRC